MGAGNRAILIDLLGWVGAAALLMAYGLVSARKVEGDSLGYQLLNLAGGALLILNSGYYGAYPSVGVNLVWMGIAALTLFRKRQRSRSS